MEYVQRQGVDLSVELGPQMVLRNLMKKNVPGLITYSYDYEPDVQSLKLMVNANEQIVNKGIEVITSCIAISICTKNSNWNDKEYQKGVVEPYNKVKKVKEDIVKEGRQPTINEVREAVEMLKIVFDTKKVPRDEQIVRFNEIFEISDLKESLKDLNLPS